MGLEVNIICGGGVLVDVVDVAVWKILSML